MSTTVEHELVTPKGSDQWKAYHDIRRRELFEARGQIGVYDENHPDDRRAANHAKLLLFRGEPVGVVRIDIDGAVAILRRVAIRSDVQGRGHGRVLLSLAQRFAIDHSCSTLASFVAPDAVGFYRSCGFVVKASKTASPSAGNSVFMTKRLARVVRPSSAIPSAPTRRGSGRRRPSG